MGATSSAAKKPGYAPEIVVVIAGWPDVKALDRAATAGIPAEVVDWSDYESRDHFSLAICDIADLHKAQAHKGCAAMPQPIEESGFSGRLLG